MNKCLKCGRSGPIIPEGSDVTIVMPEVNMTAEVVNLIKQYQEDSYRPRNQLAQAQEELKFEQQANYELGVKEQDLQVKYDKLAEAAKRTLFFIESGAIVTSNHPDVNVLRQAVENGAQDTLKDGE